MKIPWITKSGERKETPVVFDGKSEHDALVLALSRLDAVYDKPCEGKNGNVCVAEGCYGESCTKVEKEKQA